MLKKITLYSYLFLFPVTTVLTAMESNLARPYSDNPSSPHDSRLVFWSTQADDMLFEQIETEIIIHCQAGLRSVALGWALGRNRFEQPFLEGQAEALPGNRFIIRVPTGSLKPGVYDLRVALDSGAGKPVLGVCTFGYSVNSMPVTNTRPADFSIFWQRGLDALSEVPLEAHAGLMTPFSKDEIENYNLMEAALPRDYDPDGHRVQAVESCKISFNGIGNKRIYGWLAKPLGEGPFPAMLVLPGAGFHARPRPLEHARHGYLALDIQVHGQDVDLPKYPRLPGYHDGRIYEPIEDYYFYDVYLNVIQALNYLHSRPDVDKERIVVVGGSQGGRLSIIAAALDKRVKAAIPAIPHSGDVAYLKWSIAANASMPQSDGMEKHAPPALPDTPEGRCLPYYDPLNFAPDIECPVYMNVGMIDPVSYAAGVFAIYNNLGTPNKTIVPLPALGHDWSAAFDRQAWRWLDHILNSTAKADRPDTIQY